MGMVLSATALLDKNPQPNSEEIMEALAGNLCRCTGYTGILRAVTAAVAEKIAKNFYDRKMEDFERP